MCRSDGISPFMETKVSRREQEWLPKVGVIRCNLVPELIFAVKCFAGCGLTWLPGEKAFHWPLGESYRGWVKDEYEDTKDIACRCIRDADH